MKKKSLMIVAVVLSLSMLAAGSAMARRDGADDQRGQKGYNCWRTDAAADVDLEKVIEFKKETLPLRDQLLTKRLELRQEYNKEKPDLEVIAKVRKEMIDIQTSIDKVAAQYGLEDFRPERGSRGSFGPGRDDCPGRRF